MKGIKTLETTIAIAVIAVITAVIRTTVRKPKIIMHSAFRHENEIASGRGPKSRETQQRSIALEISLRTATHEPGFILHGTSHVAQSESFAPSW